MPRLLSSTLKGKSRVTHNQDLSGNATSRELTYFALRWKRDGIAFLASRNKPYDECTFHLFLSSPRRSCCLDFYNSGAWGYFVSCLFPVGTICIFTALLFDIGQKPISLMLSVRYSKRVT
jgi:hypothetical protein